MRDKFVTKKGNEGFINEWEFGTPKEVRAHAIKECITRLRTNMKLVKTKKIRRFRMRFKSKRSPKQTMTIQKASVSWVRDGFYLYKNMLKGVLKVGKRSKLATDFTIQHDVQVHFDGRHYYILIPEDRNVKEKAMDSRIIALDPGERTFQTGFHENGVVECKIRVQRQRDLFDKIRKLQSLRKKKIVKHSPKKKILKLFARIRNITNDTHHKMAKYLTQHFTDILLPSFESQDMISSKCLSKETKRQMNFNQHFRFRIRLLDKCCEVKNTRLHIVNEAYTSKTCTVCGNVKHNLGSNAIYKCEECGCIMKRDFVGARNVYLKYAMSA